MSKPKLSLLFLMLGLIILVSLSACSQPGVNSLLPAMPISTFTPLATNTAIVTFIPASTATIILSPTPSRTSTQSATTTPAFTEPENCLEPGEIYDLIEINGMFVNQRTFEMLEHAQSIYGGEIELTGYHLTQGSYTNLVSASFGTHSGGGAVDLSVIQYGTYQVLYADIDKLIEALRVSGFAAWLRDFDQLYPGSPIHIHAIAIGDRDLSGPAQEQLTGEFGYFRGYNGIPQENGKAPIPDEHGGPILCQWMLALGYADLRN